MLEYVVCFNHRSGSSWLTSLLDTAGLGPCREFHDFHFRGYEKTDNIQDFQDCLGVKAEFHAILALAKQTDLAQCKFIRLNRKDRIRQAISWYRATATWRWSSFDVNDVAEPPFNYSEIAKLIFQLDQHDNRWEEWLNGKSYISIWYEDLLSDTMGVLNQVAAYIEKPIVQIPATAFGIQRDELTERFYNQFINVRLHSML